MILLIDYHQFSQKSLSPNSHFIFYIRAFEFESPRLQSSLPSSYSAVRSDVHSFKEGFLLKLSALGSKVVCWYFYRVMVLILSSCSLSTSTSASCFHFSAVLISFSVASFSLLVSSARFSNSSRHFSVSSSFTSLNCACRPTTMFKINVESGLKGLTTRQFPLLESAF